MRDYYGLIYLCTNLINNKKYIGKTIQGFKNRIAQHKYKSTTKDNSILYNSIRKHGWDNFNWEVIEYVYSDEELSEQEKKHIKEYNTFFKNKNGYNMTYGGEGTIGHGNINEDVAYQIKELLRDTSLCTREICESLNIKREVVESVYYGSAWSHVEVENFYPRMVRSKENRKWDSIKLNDETVIKIKEMLRDGVKSKDISIKLGISANLIAHINVGRIWRHLEVEGFVFSKGRKRTTPSGEVKFVRTNFSLTVDDVIAIKKLIVIGDITLTEIATIYDVDKTTISRISQEKTYKDVIVEGFSLQKRNSKGDKNGMSKLTVEQVIEIKKMIKEGRKNSEISKIFNVQPNTISRIRTGKRWSHIRID
ncbi:GIY-YIG nuclease family protein [Priestia megaterium]|uniref:GIY-YIG nuclease family protein n=1 Tax=Priestia megaterium TaxID=1404 RepID=UPI002E24C65E|nr:GIY-YIG nuclease family protein [Priestia megaterium]